MQKLLNASRWGTKQGEKSMEDENEVHYAAIRQAFANNNASVMVGAGFSRNADGGEKLATWPDIARALSEALQPGKPLDGFATSMVSQLGEQYARVFSTPALEGLLKHLIPDDQVAPGALHEQLLRLPWTEVFTTNYDTLLERAAEKISDRAHVTVCCRQDIPLSKILDRRRIVKLHGSFPSQRPFIFTEESYRRYPEEFAPFVNLVRQSLLENVFCLIGFSGEDPNFLHWIGWVRDMLDEHVLPIYLFVHRPPSLGQRKLLEARRIISVVVPTPAGAEESDYRARYLELFRLLQLPAKEGPDKWGEFSLPIGPVSSERTHASELARVLTILPVLVERKSTYPGWLIAPAVVRAAFSRSTSAGFVHLELPNSYGVHEHAGAIISVFSYYAWQQQTLLSPITDEIASVAVAAVKEFALRPDDWADKTGVSAAMGISTASARRRAWIEAAVGCLRWARQEADEATFAALKEIIEKSGLSDPWADEIQHESILLELYLGEVESARSHLIEWRPKTVDPFMLIRKGALLAELGDVDAGIGHCLTGLKQLREAQKIERNKIDLVSREAWGCFIAKNIQRARELMATFGGGLPYEAESEGVENLGSRLTSLASKGHDVRREYETVLAELNAEAQRPSVARYTFNEFDLGSSRVTQRFGSPSELRDKVEAAEAWLALADKVSFAPRIGNVGFTTDQYMQAAWWIQYNNSSRRVFSIAIRVGSADSLKPKDEAVPQHKTGWFSRFQVAKTSVHDATIICTRALSQVEHDLRSDRNVRHVRASCAFRIELFSRLVLRVVSPQITISLLRRVIELHRGDSLQQQPELWERFALAIERCIESLAPSIREQVVPDLLRIPMLPSTLTHEHFLGSWVRPLRLLKVAARPPEGTESGRTVARDIEFLLSELEKPEALWAAGHKQARSFYWDRLLAYIALKWPNPDEEQRFVRLFWAKGIQWPVLPHFPSTLALGVPAPSGLVPPRALREYLLTRTVKGISLASSMLISSPKARRSWGFPPNNEFFKGWLAAEAREAWPSADVAAGLGLIKAWWDAEWADLEHDREVLTELNDAIGGRLAYIDEILARHWEIIQQSSDIGESVRAWCALVLNEAARIGFPLWAVQRRAAVLEGNSGALATVEKSLSDQLNAGNAGAHWRVVQALRHWLASSESHAPTRVLNYACAVVAIRRVSALALCMELLEEVLLNHASWLAQDRWELIGSGMRALLVELDYGRSVAGTDIPDEHLPLLRFRAANLAKTAKRNQMSADWIDDWLAAARVDPLPELRYLIVDSNASVSGEAL